MHREIRALRAEYTKPGGIVPTRLAEPIGNVIAAYDRRPKFTTLTDDGIQQLRVARRRAMDSGDIELLVHAVDLITGDDGTPRSINLPTSSVQRDADRIGEPEDLDNPDQRPAIEREIDRADADRAVENYRNAHPEISGMWVDEADTSPVKTIERMLGDPRPAIPDRAERSTAAARRIASILAPHADDDGISTKAEIAALRMELASLFCRVTEWTGDRMERDTTSITRGGVTRFEVEIVDAPGENDLRRVAARAARSFRQPDGIAIRLPDGSTYRIDAEGVAR